MTLGFDKPLYVLPFSHCGSFETNMFGWEGAPPTPEQTREIAAAKHVIYDVFKAAVSAGVTDGIDQGKSVSQDMKNQIETERTS